MLVFMSVCIHVLSYMCIRVCVHILLYVCVFECMYSCGFSMYTCVSELFVCTRVCLFELFVCSCVCVAPVPAEPGPGGAVVPGAVQVGGQRGGAALCEEQPSAGEAGLVQQGGVCPPVFPRVP